MTTRPATACRPSLRLLGLAGLVAFAALAAGCNSRRSEPGGATNRKARESRDLAQEMALAGVKGAIDHQIAVHGELDKRGPWSKGWDRMTGGGKPPAVTSPVSATASPADPPAPAKVSSEKGSVTLVVASTKPPAPDPKPSADVVIREKVASEFPYPTPVGAEADEDALEQAAGRIEARLRGLDPPVHYRPTAGTVRNEFVRRGSRTTRLPNDIEKEGLAKIGYGEGRQYVEYTVEVTADQVRELRTRARLGSALRVLGVVAGAALASFLFLRLDEWTKGYLTSWLAFAAVALAGGVAATLVVV